MSHAQWLEFFLLNSSAAAAIAIDACVLVISKFRQFRNSFVALKWAAAVGFTHIVFPLLGFMGGWMLIERYQAALAVYSVGALLLIVLIIFVIKESTSEHTEESQRSREHGFFGFWVPVFSVSMDALLAGPGKTVLLERYPRQWAWISFVLVGTMVAIFTLSAGFVSTRLRRRWISRGDLSVDFVSNVLTSGIFLEIVLFSFFAIWSLSKASESLSPQFALSFRDVLIVSTCAGMGLVLCFFVRIKSTQLARVQVMLDRRSIRPNLIHT